MYSIESILLLVGIQFLSHYKPYTVPIGFGVLNYGPGVLCLSPAHLATLYHAMILSPHAFSE